MKLSWLIIGFMLGAAFTLIFIPCAHAMEANDASAKCATAIDGYLRDPDTAQYQWRDRVVLGKGDSWRVILPVRGQNAYGAYVTERYGCLIAGGHVVKVIH